MAGLRLRLCANIPAAIYKATTPIETARVFVCYVAIGVILDICISQQHVKYDPSYGEAKGLLETQAKYSLLAIENFKSTNASFSDKSIMDLIHLYYLTNRTEYLNQAEDDISYYFPRCLSVEWRVYTTDGMLDVESFNFSSTKSRSSAQTTVLDRTELVVVAGAG